MELTAKQYGYTIQALAETARRMKSNGDWLNERKLKITLQQTLNVRKLSQFYQAFDEEQLTLIVQSLEGTAEIKQQKVTSFDAEMMRETAKTIRSVKDQREAAWIQARFQEGIRIEAAI